MPFFSRRSTQKLIDETSKVIEGDFLPALVEKLNRRDDQSLGALWEIIVINLLAKNGKVKYEFSHGGRTKPDIYYNNSLDFEMIADITCVSDRSQNEANDVEYFTRELSLVAKKLGIADLSGFNIQVGENLNLDNKRVTLKLPKKVQTREFIGAKLKPFLIQVGNNRHVSHHTEVFEEDAELTIEYNPKSKSFTCGYRSFNLTKSLTNNPLYSRLNDKRQQLKDSGYQGLKGLIICDGSCDLITSSFSDLYSCSAESIIEKFLCSQNTISFVLLLFINEKSEDILSNKMSRKFDIKYLAKDHCKDKIRNVVRLIDVSFRELPKVIATSRNALNSLKNKRTFPSTGFYGGFSMNEKRVAISARAILDLISGKLSSGKFIEDHEEAGTFLRTKINDGYKLKSISLKVNDDLDDDWLEFEFDAAFDPAVTRFK